MKATHNHALPEVNLFYFSFWTFFSASPCVCELLIQMGS